MSLQTFFDNFTLLADAPNGQQNLRKLILQLAFEGKLVSQNPYDEPASVLLKEISRNKAIANSNNGKRNKKKPPLPEIEDRKTPFALPDGWQWGRFVDVATIASNLVHPKDYLDYPHIAPDNIEKFTGKLLPYRSVRDDKVSSSNHKFFSGQIVYSKIRPNLAKAVIVDFEGLCSADMYPIDVHIFPHYLLKYMLSETFLNMAVKTDTRVAMPKINQEELNKILVPVPPLEEQKRIVVKVDELMQLCAELEARQQARRESRVRFNNVTLAPLDNAASLAPEEFEQASVRLADNFAALYDSAETVNRFRSTILRLAVQGKLVSQDSNDEPANALLEKITWAKMRLSKEKKIRQPELILSGERIEAPFQLPEGWLWARFGDVTINRDGERIPLEKSVRQGRQGIYDYYGASGVIDKIDDYLFDKPLLLIGEDGANLINRSTPIAFIAKGKYWVNNHAHVLDSVSLACLEYLEVFINAIDLRPYITGTAQPKMNQAKMNSILVALAPEEEQKRIVAKVNQLMALCDELETRLRQAEADSEKLMKAAVSHVLALINESPEAESISNAA